MRVTLQRHFSWIDSMQAELSIYDLYVILEGLVARLPVSLSGLLPPFQVLTTTTTHAWPKMQWKTLSLALLVQHGYSQSTQFPMMRFSCSQLVIDRLDPLVNPGSIPSAHLHQIVGGVHLPYHRALPRPNWWLTAD
jgi:hypothetical protein